ncbi:mechanosensitive ion channel [Sulfurimonas aquatica]|uniref:Mechanosensitive ion channel n=1 Tax=Sulfurimonas aquatica TaxID=2672570 RepID=A0A975B2A2_9BACT|nr:mechanosensitive ion channel family protein [Sulfurimonas aquatica]QSZ42919.1 mechanosensitive ion channel [Sulfurimonas aquatica]
MIKIIFSLLFSFCFILADTNTTAPIKKNIWDNDNIWIKTYANNRNYKIIINNIVKIEQKIKKVKYDMEYLEELHSRLEVQKSKLNLYERNKSFDRLLLPYKFEVQEITIQDYVFKDAKNQLSKTIDKYIELKNEFYKAHSLLKSSAKKEKLVRKADLEYFKEFSQNIDKTYSNLIEAKNELDEKYELYLENKLQKHLITSYILLAAYIIYKIFSYFLLYIESKLHKETSQIRYKKVLSIFFFLGTFIFLVVRYMEDFLYIVTFLSVVAAALTIATREIILNIIGSIYIFFSNMVRVGDRIMVQFETKHTIGDIVDISLMKIKLNEIEDYSNLKEIKNVGRTIYVPNSYVFTKVFYNYSRKKDGLINDLIEFEFTPATDFSEVEKITSDVFSKLESDFKITFTLNNLKTGIIGLISYNINYKVASKMRGEISIKLLQAYSDSGNIKLKSSKPSTKAKVDDGE